MSTYLGPLGGLVETHCLSGLSETPRTKRIEQEGIDGSVVVRKIGRAWRKWACDIGAARPEDVANLRTLAGEQDAAWWMVACNAQRTNLLTPAASRFRDWEVIPQPPIQLGPIQRGGNVITEDGVAVASALLEVTSWFAYQSIPVPVPPDRGDVTASVYLRPPNGGTASARLIFTDGSGRNSQTQHHTVSTTVTSGPLPRLTVTGPANAAAGARIQIRGATVAANPAITWGSTPYPWTDGRGAERVVLGDVPESVITAAPDNRWSSFNYEVTEVRA